MPSVAVKLYSLFFKFLLKHRLQNRIQTPFDGANSFGITSRPEEVIAAAKPSFTDGVATKDIHIDPFTALSIRVFLPETAISGPNNDSQSQSTVRARVRVASSKSHSELDSGNYSADCDLHHLTRHNSFGPSGTAVVAVSRTEKCRSISDAESLNGVAYGGYSPSLDGQHRACRKLPVIVQFHGGGFVSGSNDSVANDVFCRRIAKLCDVMVIGVGYRLAPETRYPAAFEDGMKVLNWLGKQANLAECNKSLGNARSGGADVNRHIVDVFGASLVEPWLAAHGDPSRASNGIIHLQ